MVTLSIVIITPLSVLEARRDVDSVNSAVLEASRRAVEALSQKFEDRFQQSEFLSHVWSARISPNTSQSTLPMVDPVMIAANRFLTGRKESMGMGFLELVFNGTSREIFEGRQAAAFGMEKGRLMEFGPDGVREIGPQSPRRSWFAVIAAAADYNFAATKGLDVASSMPRRELLQVARLENRLSVTSPLTLPTTTNGVLTPTPGFVTYTPVFSLGPITPGIPSPEYNSSSWEGEEPSILRVREGVPMPGAPVNESLFPLRGWITGLYASRQVAVLDAESAVGDAHGLEIGVWDARDDAKLVEIVDSKASKQGKAVQHELDGVRGVFFMGAAVSNDHSTELGEEESSRVMASPRFSPMGFINRITFVLRLRDSVWNVAVSPTKQFINNSNPNQFASLLLISVIVSVLIITVTIAALELLHAYIHASKERETAEQEHSDRMRAAIQSIINYATHELRNPLQVVLGELALMRMQSPGRRRSSVSGRESNGSDVSLEFSHQRASSVDQKRKRSVEEDEGEDGGGGEGEGFGGLSSGMLAGEVEDGAIRIEDAALTMKRVVEQMTEVAKMRESEEIVTLEAISPHLTTRNAVIDAALPRGFLIHTIVDPNVPKVCLLDRSHVTSLVSTLAEIAGEHASGDSARIMVHVESQSLHNVRKHSSYLHSSDLSLHASLIQPTPSFFPSPCCARGAAIADDASGHTHHDTFLENALLYEAMAIRQKAINPHAVFAATSSSDSTASPQPSKPLAKLPPFGLFDFFYPHLSSEEGALWIWEEREGTLATYPVSSSSSISSPTDRLITALGKQQLSTLGASSPHSLPHNWEKDPSLPMLCFDLALNAPTLEPTRLFEVLWSLGVVSLPKGVHNPWKAPRTPLPDLQSFPSSTGSKTDDTPIPSGYSSLVHGMVLSISALWHAAHTLHGYVTFIDRRSDGGNLILRVAIPLIPSATSLATLHDATAANALAEFVESQRLPHLKHPPELSKDEAVSAIKTSTSSLTPTPATIKLHAEKGGGEGGEEEGEKGAGVARSSQTLPHAHISGAVSKKPRRSRKQAVGRVLASKHVLVVDDEEPVRDLLCRMLHRLGATTEQLSDGDEVEGVLTERGLLGRGGGEGGVSQQFDAILMDIAMARSDGAVVTKRIVRDLGLSIPVVASTANHQEWDVVRYRKSGFAAVLGKPISIERLQKTLEEVFVSGAVPSAAAASEPQLSPHLASPSADEVGAGDSVGVNVERRLDQQPRGLSKVHVVDMSNPNSPTLSQSDLKEQSSEMRWRRQLSCTSWVSGSRLELLRRVLLLVVMGVFGVVNSAASFAVDPVKATTVPMLLVTLDIGEVLSSLYFAFSLLALIFLAIAHFFPSVPQPNFGFWNSIFLVAPESSSPFAATWTMLVCTICGTISFLFGSAHIALQYSVCAYVRGTPGGMEALLEAMSTSNGVGQWGEWEVGSEYATRCIAEAGRAVAPLVLSWLGLAFFAPFCILLLTAGWIPSVPFLSLLLIELPIVVSALYGAIVTQVANGVVLVLMLIPMAAITFFIVSEVSEMTERAIAERQAKDAAARQARQKEMSAIVAGQLAHDISHSMHAALDSTETLASAMRSLPDDSVEKQSLDSLNASLYLASRLLADSLDSAALSEGRLRLQSAPGNLMETIEQMRVVGSGIGEARVEVEAHDCPHLDHAIFDPVRVEQLMLNGLSNAAKFAPPQSLIRVVVDEFSSLPTLIATVRTTESLPTSSKLFAVSAHPLLPASVKSSEILGATAIQSLTLSDDRTHLHQNSVDTIWVRIRILDNGPGLRGESAARLFRRFEQSLLQVTAEAAVGGGRSLERIRGRGLGLSMVARLSLLMGGAVALRDRSDGQTGCVFDAVLPMGVAVRARVPRERRRRGSIQPIPLLVGHAAIIADDQLLIRRMMVRTLKRLGAANVVACENGEQMVELLTSSPPPEPVVAVFVDQDMGEGMSGLETARQLRESGFFFPIVLVSGNVSDLALVGEAEHSITHALRKPFSAVDVENLLKSWEGKG